MFYEETYFSIRHGQHVLPLSPKIKIFGGPGKKKVIFGSKKMHWRKWRYWRYRQKRQDRHAKNDMANLANLTKLTRKFANFANFAKQIFNKPDDIRGHGHRKIR